METKQVVRRMLSGSILRTLSLTSSVLVAFFMLPFLVHNLGNEQYGLWVVVGSLIGFYGFFDLGFAAAVGRYVSQSIGKKDYEQVNRIINTALAIFTTLGGIVILLSLFGAGGILLWYDSNNTELFALLFVILGVNIGLQFPLRTFSGVLASQMRFDIIVGVELARLILRTVFIVTFVKMGYGVLALALTAVVVEVSCNLFEYYLMRKNAPFIKFGRQYFKRDMIKHLIHYSWAAFIINMSEMAKTKLIPVFVSAVLGLSTVVLYTIALRLLEYLELLLRNCVGFIMPVLSRFEGEDNEARIRKTFQYVTVFSIMVSTFVGMSIFFYGETFISLWVGAEFTQSYKITLIMLVPFVLMTIQIPAKELVMALSKHQVYAFLTLSQVINICILSFALTTDKEVTSVAYAVMFGIGIIEIIKPYFTAKALEENILNVYWMYIYNIVLCVGILSLFYYVVLTYLTYSYLSIIVLSAIQCVYFFTVCYLLVFPKQLRNVLYQTIILPMLQRAHIT